MSSTGSAHERTRAREGEERRHLAAAIIEMLNRVPPTFQSWDYTYTHGFKVAVAAASKIASSEKANLRALREAHNKLSSYYAGR